MTNKRCPSCGQTYTEDAINFCLNDGELLSYLADDVPPTQFGDGRQSTPFEDDSSPTVVLDRPRVTNQTNWPVSEPPAVWQGGQQNFPQQQYAPYYVNASPNLTLAIVSLCLGISSLVIGWCCSTGLVLSPAALIIGFIALSQIKKDPQATGGRGMAIGGIVTGMVYLGFYIIIMLVYVIAMIGGIN